MKSKLITLLLRLLKSKQLSEADRARVLNSLLASVQALPVREIITYDLDGTMIVNGRKLTTEQAISMKQAATSLQNNRFYRLIKEQIAWEAIKMGIHQSHVFDAVLMSKSALWIQSEEMKLIRNVAGEELELLD